MIFKKHHEINMFSELFVKCDACNSWRCVIDHALINALIDKSACKSQLMRKLMCGKK